MDPRQARQELFEKIAVATAAGRLALVVFDLDGTLYDNAPRTLRILTEFAHEHALEHPGLLEQIHAIPLSRVRYGIADTLAPYGVSDPALIEALKAYWFARFFTNDYLVHDLPSPGAAAFVHQVLAAGGTPVYLTGRDAPNMLLGTVTTLQRDGFPVGTLDTRAILKDCFERPDGEFKAAVIEHLRHAGAVVGAFDNEPGLCNMFKEAFPEAIVAWLDTSHAPGAPALRQDVLRTKDFVALADAEN